MRYRLESGLDEHTVRCIDALCVEGRNGHYTQHPLWARLSKDWAEGRRLFFTGVDGAHVKVAAVVKLRNVPLLPLVVVDVSRGPVADSPESLLSGLAALRDLLATEKPVALRVDPAWSGPGSAEIRNGLTALGFRPINQVCGISLQIDINKDRQALMSSFRRMCRRNIRRALGLGVEVRQDLDDVALQKLDGLYRRMVTVKGVPRLPARFTTALRDYCRELPERGCFLSSWLGQELLGALAVFTFGRRSMYGYSASRLDLPDVPKTYLLHLAAMEHARGKGCVVYDIGGVGSGIGTSATWTSVQKNNYFFKSNFGGREVDVVAAHELILRPVPYHLIRSTRRLLQARPRGLPNRQA